MKILILVVCYFDVNLEANFKEFYRNITEEMKK